MKIVTYNAVAVDSMIQIIRGQRVILDTDLARIYGVTTKRLNEQVRRNEDRFPDDFVFQIAPHEYADLKSQIATSSLQHAGNQQDNQNRVRSELGQTHGGRRKLPYAFTEHGAIMAANVLNSPQACANECLCGSCLRAYAPDVEHTP